jgi:hypothetical protein
MISILQQLESFNQLLCLTELEREDIIEPWLNHYLVRLHLFQLVHSHFVLPVTDESCDQMMPPLRRKSKPTFFHLLHDLLAKKVIGMDCQHLFNPSASINFPSIDTNLQNTMIQPRIRNDPILLHLNQQILHHLRAPKLRIRIRS